MAMMRSPPLLSAVDCGSGLLGITPATSAGPPAITEVTYAPVNWVNPRLVISSRDMLSKTSIVEIPRYGNSNVPVSIRLGTTFLTIFTDMATPIPELAGSPVEVELLVRIAWLTPMTSPARLSKGPPEFPGLRAASVWIISLDEKNPPSGAEATSESNDLPRAETMPVVMVLSKPNGLPIATTTWPTLSKLESPNVNGNNSSAGTSTLITARSASALAPINSPNALKPDVKSTS